MGSEASRASPSPPTGPVPSGAGVRRDRVGRQGDPEEDRPDPEREERGRGSGEEGPPGQAQTADDERGIKGSGRSVGLGSEEFVDRRIDLVGGVGRATVDVHERPRGPRDDHEVADRAHGWVDDRVCLANGLVAGRPGGWCRHAGSIERVSMCPASARGVPRSRGRCPEPTGDRAGRVRRGVWAGPGAGSARAGRWVSAGRALPRRRVPPRGLARSPRRGPRPPACPG